MTEAQKQKLLLPFPASDIEWRTAYTNTEKPKGFAVCKFSSHSRAAG